MAAVTWQSGMALAWPGCQHQQHLTSVYSSCTMRTLPCAFSHLPIVQLSSGLARSSGT